MNKNKKLKKTVKKAARKQAKKTLFEQAEFSNSSPLRGTAYFLMGQRYGW